MIIASFDLLVLKEPNIQTQHYRKYGNMLVNRNVKPYLLFLHVETCIIIIKINELAF